MVMTMEELLDKYPVDRAKVEEHRERMFTAVRAHGESEPHEVPAPATHGARIAFVRPEHGVQSLVDPFQDHR